jgi:hypothetical protein
MFVVLFLGFLHVNLHLWWIQHNKGHHCYTNIPKADPDLNHFLHDIDDAPGYRLHPDQAYLSKYVWWKVAVFYQSTASSMALSFMLLPQFLQVLVILSWVTRSHASVMLRFHCVCVCLQDKKVSQVSPIPTELIPGIIAERAVLGCLVAAVLYRLTLFKGISFCLFSWAIHGMLFYLFSQIR